VSSDCLCIFCSITAISETSSDRFSGLPSAPTLVDLKRAASAGIANAVLFSIVIYF
jgi:hypothetical protein